MYNNRRLQSSQSVAIHSGKKSKSRKHHPTHQSMPMYGAPFMAAIPMMYPPVQEVEEEEETSDEEMVSIELSLPPRLHIFMYCCFSHLFSRISLKWPS